MRIMRFCMLFSLFFPFIVYCFIDPVVCLAPSSNSINSNNGNNNGSSLNQPQEQQQQLTQSPVSTRTGPVRIPSFPPTKSAVIVSTNKNNGAVKRFYLRNNENNNDERQQRRTTFMEKMVPTSIKNNEENDSRVLRNANNANDNIYKAIRLRVLVLYDSIASILRTTFLPSGYPKTTPNGYIQYCIWSSIQDLTTQLRSVLATQRILEGVGVGRADATSLSALFNFIIRDGCGMIASLLFTSKFASQFKSNIKRYRLFADIMVDIGITLEIIAVLLPMKWFLPMICCGNICKAICGVAAGSCGGAINLFWTSSGSDISDIQAKFGAQNTITASLGLLASALFAKSVNSGNNINSTNQASVKLYLLYTLLTILHIYANVRCMKLIAFTSFNTMRLQLILNNHFLDEWSRTTKITVEQLSYEQQQNNIISIPTPRDIATREPLFFLLPQIREFLRSKLIYNLRWKHTARSANIPPSSSIPILFGVSFNEFQQRSNKAPNDLGNLALFTNSNSCDSSSDTDFYLISTGNMRGKNRYCVVVSLSENCTPETQIHAYLHASLLRRKLQQQQQKRPHLPEPPASSSPLMIETDVANEMPSIWSSFQSSCMHAGWNIMAPSELKTQGYGITCSTS